MATPSIPQGGCLDVTSTIPPDEIGVHGAAFSNEWLESVVTGSFKVWHLIFLSAGGTFAVIIFLCCVCKIRIPRTKQEIEADYIRRKIADKFRKKLRELSNREMDDLDLKQALERVRAEFISDAESVSASDLANGSPAASTYTKGLTLEDFTVEKVRRLKRRRLQPHRV